MPDPVLQEHDHEAHEPKKDEPQHGAVASRFLPGHAPVRERIEVASEAADESRDRSHVQQK